MAEDVGESRHVEVRSQELGKGESYRARQSRAGREYQARVAKALDLYESMGSEQQALMSVRAICVQALPGAMRNLVSMALGKKKGCPAAVQREAIKMVAGGAGVALEAAPSAESGRPLAEMSLGELESVLTQLASRARDMQAIESTGTVLPNEGSTISESALTSPSAAAGVGTHPPAGGSSEPG